jgi:hypothetical protein
MLLGKLILAFFKVFFISYSSQFELHAGACELDALDQISDIHPEKINNFQLVTLGLSAVL